MSVTIFIIVDAMSSGSWFITESFVHTKSNILFSLWGMQLFFVIRLFINAMGMVIVASILSNSDDFVSLFGPFFEHSRIVGDWILTGEYRYILGKLKLIKNQEKEANEVISEETLEFETVNI